jgi:hypothetical protein
MKFAKKFKDLAVPPSVKYHLHKAMAGEQPARSLNRTHASDLTNPDKSWCPREVALLLATGTKPKGQFIGTSMQYTFDMGWAMHEYVNEKWLGDRAIGDWKCERCGHMARFCSRPMKCPNCSSPGMRHREINVISKINGVSGGLDLIVNIDEPKYRIVELKTIKSDDFKLLAAPLAEHRLRTNLYMRLTREAEPEWLDQVNTDEAFVLYMCKGYGNKDARVAEWGLKDSGFSPFKEFIVKRDDSATEAMLAKGKLLEEFRNGGPVPSGVCDTALCKRAQKCSMVKPCWSGQYPAGVSS